MGSDGSFIHIFSFSSCLFHIPTPPILHLLKLLPMAQAFHSVFPSSLKASFPVLVKGLFHWRTTNISVSGCSALSGGCLDSLSFFPAVIYFDARSQGTKGDSRQCKLCLISAMTYYTSVSSISFRD